MNNLLLLSALVVIVASIGSCYDFEDSEYNRVLSYDLEELYEPDYTAHPRARRDEEAAAATVDKEKCKRRRYKGCCADETMESLHEEDKQIKKECFKQVTGGDRDSRGYGYGSFHHDHFKCDKDRVEKHRKEMTCVYQCVGQKRNVVDATGKINEEEFKKIIKEKIAKFEKEAWLLPKLDVISDKCLKEGIEAAEKQDKTEKDSCSPAMMKVGHCLWREIQLACPADQIKDEKSCGKIRDRIKNHPDSPFKPPMMDDFE